MNSDFVAYELSNRISRSFQASLEDENSFDIDGKGAEYFKSLNRDGNLDEIFRMIPNDDLSEVEELRRTTSNHKKNSVESLGSFTKRLPTDKLEDLVAKMESIIIENEGPEAFSENNDVDAPYLDPDIYANYCDHLNTDGSLSIQPKGNFSSFNSLSANEMNLKASVNSQLNLPDSYFTTNTSATSDASLLERLFESKPGNVNEVDEDLHKQIMAGEEAFQEQSESFQEFLNGGTSDDGDKAGYMLRQKVIEEKQRESLDQLEKEMSDLEQILDENERKMDSKTATCPKCNLPLTKIEIESRNGRGLCQVCLADEIANSGTKSYRNNFSSPSRPFTKTPSRSYDQKLPTPLSTENTKSSRSFSETKAPRKSPPSTFISEGGEVKDLKMRVLALQQQVQKYKRHIEVLERQRKAEEAENTELRQQIRHLKDELQNAQGGTPLDSGNEGENEEDALTPWVEVIDPDTGETFFWNENTEEMKWEM